MESVPDRRCEGQAWATTSYCPPCLAKQLVELGPAVQGAGRPQSAQRNLSRCVGHFLRAGAKSILPWCGFLFQVPSILALCKRASWEALPWNRKMGTHPSGPNTRQYVLRTP